MPVQPAPPSRGASATSAPASIAITAPPLPGAPPVPGAPPLPVPAAPPLPLAPPAPEPALPPAPASFFGNPLETLPQAETVAPSTTRISQAGVARHRTLPSLRRSPTTVGLICVASTLDGAPRRCQTPARRHDRDTLVMYTDT